MSYMDFYYKYAETGKLPKAGLCNCFSADQLDLIMPDDYWPWDFWAYDRLYGLDVLNNASLRTRVAYTFGPLRQNLVLLLAALNNEL